MLLRRLLVAILCCTSMALAAPDTDQAQPSPSPETVEMFPAFDDGLSAQTLDLEVLVARAREHNPDLKTLHHAWKAAEAVVPQARAVPDPRFNVQYSQVPGFANPRFIHRGYAQVGIAQVIPGHGKIPARARVAELEAEVRRHLLRERSNEVETEIRKLAVDLYLVEIKIQLNRKHQQIVDHFARVAGIQYEVGKGAQPDVVRAQAERTRIENDLARLWGQRSRLRAQLAYLCGGEIPAGRAPEPPGTNDLSFERAALLQLAREYRPRLNALAVQIEKSKARGRLAETEDNPDVTLSLMNRWFAYRPDGIMLSVSVPLPFFNRQRYDAAVEQSLHQTQSAEAMLEQTVARLDFEIEARLLAIQTALQQRDIVEKTLMVQVRQVLRGSLSNYQTGKLDFLNLLDAQRQLLNLELSSYGYTVEAARALVELEGLVGLDLSRPPPPATPIELEAIENE